MTPPTKEQATGTVYAVQDDGSKNLTIASEYGRVTAIATRDIPLHSSPDSFVDDMKASLANFNPKAGDWLLLIGDPVRIGVAVAIVAKMTGGWVPCLKYDRQSRRYFPVQLNYL